MEVRNGSDGKGGMMELPWEDSLLERKVESDLKDLLKTLVAFANSVRPGHTATILIGEKDGEPCVRVEIEYSGETPHFGGPAWVRKGSESIPANDELFQRLIEFRLSKVRELAMWLGKQITVEGDASSVDFR